MAEPKDLKTRFYKEIAPKLKEELGLKNIMAVPKIEKVQINVGTGSILQGGKDNSQILENIAAITGQRPVTTKAKKAISNFKIREGLGVGVTVTLRGKRMYDFINKLVNVVFPRVRDFRGISPKSFDGQGNYTVGIKEHVVFLEINPDDMEKIHGLQITVSTTAKNDEEGRALLSALGFPFKKT
ncbi:MAG: 50S ribosomal protein L5 [Patescibacteria group bacterium]|nr:50S ribosomal protein L5 [Patescibacteria group bacterium]